MWFDAQAALAELVGDDMPPSDPPASVAHCAPVAQAEQPESCVAPVARVARPPTLDSEAFPHGMTPEGRPRTWTGRIVSLDDWRNLTDWERHGPDGRMWNGMTRQWETCDGPKLGGKGGDWQRT
jgi:hypothetical protein